MSTFTDTTSLRPFKFLSRWALIAGLVYLGLFIAFFMEFPIIQNSGLSEDYSELALAAHSPAMLQMIAALSLVYWIMIGVFLVSIAVTLFRHAPIRSAFIAACGVGQIVGALGGLMSLNGVTDLAARYMTASVDQQTGLLQAYLNLRLSYTTYYEVSGALWSIALLMTAWAAWSAKDFFPRWLAILCAVSGLIGTLNFASIISAGKYGAPVMAELSLMIVFFAVAIAFWRRTPVGLKLKVKSTQPTS